MSEIPTSDEVSFNTMRVGNQLPTYDIGATGRYIVEKYLTVDRILLKVKDDKTEIMLKELQAYYDANSERPCAKVMTSIVFVGHMYAWKDSSDVWCRVQAVAFHIAHRQAFVIPVDHNGSDRKIVPMQSLRNLESRFWHLPAKVFPASIANIKRSEAPNEYHIRELLDDANLLRTGQEVIGFFPDGRTKPNITYEEPAAMFFFQIHDNRVKDVQAYLIALDFIQAQDVRRREHDWTKLFDLIDINADPAFTKAILNAKMKF